MPVDDVDGDSRGYCREGNGSGWGEKRPGNRPPLGHHARMNGRDKSEIGEKTNLRAAGAWPELEQSVEHLKLPPLLVYFTGKEKYVVINTR